MDQKLDDLLCKKYPKIFADRNADMTTTCMCWGFSCGEGWFSILDQLCGNIQHHIDWSVKNNASDIEFEKMRSTAVAGDFTLFNKEYAAMSPEFVARMKADLLKMKPREIRKVVPQVVASQVKEKYGTLRFYYSGGDDVVNGMVRMADSMSGVTCEECGNPGKSYGGGWITTLCPDHAEKRGLFATPEDDFDDKEGEDSDDNK
jgi:hypothetical protein